MLDYLAMNNNLLKDYFYYSRAEKYGVVVLSSMVVLLFVLPAAYPLLFKKEKIDFSEIEIIAAQLEHSQVVEAAADNITTLPKAVELFTFNPNTASKEEFLALGLSPKQANTIINYRSKGGKFFKKEDLQKIYGLKAADYERLAPYVDVPSDDTFFTKKEQTTEHATSIEGKEVAVESFPFDPNKASKEDWLKLGVSEKTASTILKYRMKGGKFRKAEDLKKIYTLKAADYDRLAPYITIEGEEEEVLGFAATVPNDVPKSYDVPTKPKKNTTVKININTATVEDWKRLNGIGEGYAKRIIKFRNVLGGFVSIDQIGETYGLPDSTFQKIKPQLTFTGEGIKKININTADLVTLKAHPYLETKHANAIVNYRKHHGKYAAVEDLQKVIAVNKKVYKKIKPYLAVE